MMSAGSKLACLQKASGWNYFDDFLRQSERDILTHAGKTSHETALSRAHAEYEKYSTFHADYPSPVEKHFLEAIDEMKKLEKRKGKKG